MPPYFRSPRSLTRQQPQHKHRFAYVLFATSDDSLSVVIDFQTSVDMREFATIAFGLKPEVEQREVDVVDSFDNFIVDKATAFHALNLRQELLSVDKLFFHLDSAR